MWKTLVFWLFASLMGAALGIPADKVTSSSLADSTVSQTDLPPDVVTATTTHYTTDSTINVNSIKIQESTTPHTEANKSISQRNNNSNYNSDSKDINNASETQIIIRFNKTQDAFIEELINSIFKPSKESFDINQSTINQTVNDTKPQTQNDTPIENITNTKASTDGSHLSSTVSNSSACLGTCVVYYLCHDGAIDGITNECSDPLEVCCQDIVEMNNPTTSKTVTPSELPEATTNRKPVNTIRNIECGRSVALNSNIHVDADNDQSTYGEFPWMVWISDSSLNTLCGGSLIHPKVVLTAAHCVNKKDNLIIRAGEWKIDSQVDEEEPHQEVKVTEVVVHDNFNDGSLAHDPALLILETPVKLSGNVGLVCLPEAQADMNGSDCIASGWGKQLSKNQSDENQTIMKRVGPLPIIPRDECQESLRKTKLGERFRLHETFICAGGTPGTDTCKGDGGSPLVCPSKTDGTKYIQAGIVAWGISCGTDTPGVYVNVPHFVPWIEDQLVAKGIFSEEVSDINSNNNKNGGDTQS